MSERIMLKHEHAEVLPALPTPEQAEPLRPGEADPAKALQEARGAVAETTQAETQANPLEALQAAENAPEPTAALPGHAVNRELKQINAQRGLQRVRRQLPAPGRLLSRVIHQPVIRVASEAAGQTVSRPSGLLGGGLVAFFGTSGYLYLAKHIGFTYNYLVFLLLLAGGFVLGVVLESLVYLALPSRRSRD